MEHAPNTDEALDRLVDVAIKFEIRFKMEILCNLSDKMPNRVKAVHKAEGWHTKY
jgi:hypothetical protein